MKLIKVDCCGSCPSKDEIFVMGTGKVYICTHPERTGMRLKDLSIVSFDCPLEDEMEEK